MASKSIGIFCLIKHKKFNNIWKSHNQNPKLHIKVVNYNSNYSTKILNQVYIYIFCVVHKLYQVKHFEI